MLEKFRYILSKIEVIRHPERGASIQLIDYEHLDYIEDVLCEKFDLEYDFCSNEDVTGDYVLYFGKVATFEQVKRAVEEINEYQSTNKKEYKVAPYT